MEHLTALLQELQTRQFKVSDTAKGQTIQQTQRNKLKVELLQALKQDIQQAYEYVYQSEEGILLEIANDDIANAVDGDEGSGAITAVIDIKIKNLNFDAELETQSYEEKKQAKAEKKKADAEKKAAKIQRDKELRAAKAKKEE